MLANAEEASIRSRIGFHTFKFWESSVYLPCRSRVTEKSDYSVVVVPLERPSPQRGHRVWMAADDDFKKAFGCDAEYPGFPCSHGVRKAAHPFIAPIRADGVLQQVTTLLPETPGTTACVVRHPVEERA